jgi:hypothetical protein
MFAWASTPMVAGAVAAIGVAALCYRRFRGFRLDDRPAEPEAAAPASAIQPRPT